jgi:hypothetical protein
MMVYCLIHSESDVYISTLKVVCKCIQMKQRVGSYCLGITNEP